MEEEKKKYTASAQVEQARQEAKASDEKKPGEYVSKWQQQLDAAMEKILNREKFSYNLNGDALYRQYKDQAIQNGRLAMQDTLGQAAAMTGGFGSSYGQTAAQQAYRQQMANLGDKASALYDKARSEYDRQGTADKQAYDLIVDGKRVDAPPKEIELLYFLASSPNRVFTRAQLLDDVWGFDYFGDTRTVDVHVKRLREKLEGVSDKWELKTVWGVGYKFEVRQ